MLKKTSLNVVKKLVARSGNGKSGMSMHQEHGRGDRAACLGVRMQGLATGQDAYTGWSQDHHHTERLKNWIVELLLSPCTTCSLHDARDAHHEAPYASHMMHHL